jgi:HTH-type transcriptional regulator/antitoxin HipB
MPFKEYIDNMLYKAYMSSMRYPIQTPLQLAIHLRSLRRTRGLTQAQLGAMVGLDQTRIAKIERDPQLVSTGQLLQILAALGVQMQLQTQATDSPASPDPSDW